MLDFVRGNVVRIDLDAAVLEVGGVGIRILMPVRDLTKLGATAIVHTILQIRDDDPVLYGFATLESRDLFKSLVSVQGVGPKVALAILSFHGTDNTQIAITSADDGALALSPGVGKKTAQRIILELRGKLIGPDEPAAAPKSDAIADVREALKAMGYTGAEAVKATEDLPEDGDEQTLLRLALRGLAQKVSP